MVHFFEELWRFKGLGLPWAILIAILIVGLREASKRIDNRNMLVGIFILGISCFIVSSILILNNQKKQITAKKDPKYQTDEVHLQIDSVVQTTIDTNTYYFVPDRTQLTCDFMGGDWEVVSTDIDSVINTRVKFKCANSYKNMSIESEECKFKLRPTSEYSISHFVGNCYGEIDLILERDGSHMRGILKIKYEEIFPERKEKLKSYDLFFTKLY